MIAPTSQVNLDGIRPAGDITGPEASRATEALLPDQLVQVDQLPPADQGPRPASSDSDEETLQQLHEATERANEHFQRTETLLKFEVGRRTGRIIVKVIDKNTNELVRTIPPEDFNQFTKRLDQVRGLLFDGEG